jgi:nucleolar MIF4G domain-containing protein 1
VDCERLFIASNPQSKFLIADSLHHTDGWIQPVDFTILKPQTGEFLTELFTQLFISSQTLIPTLGPHSKELQTVEQNREAVHEIFIKVTRMETLTMGLIYFMSKTFHANTDNEMVKWASEVALETLQTG